MMRQLLVFLLAVFCFALGGTASAADKAAFVEACLGSNNLGQAICECCADIAKAELSPAGFDFLTANLKGDTAAADSLRGQLSMPEVIKASMFMVNTPGRCAQESSG